MKAEELIAKYPRLFPDGKCTCGVTIGPGWMPIVDKLCADIIEVCDREGLDPPTVEQVKEKFAGLRFYISRGNDSVRTLIREAEDRCEKTCEDCGAPGKVRSGRWIRTLCDECEKPKPSRFQ